MSITKELLKARGITDAVAYLEAAEEKGRLEFVESPQIEAKGSIHLILRRIIRRDEVESRLANLKHV